METKYNEATLNRPEGDRVLDAPYVFADLKKFRKQLRKEDAWDKNDRNSITIYKTDGFTIVLSCLRKNAAMPDNSVNGLLTIKVMEGSIDIVFAQHSLFVKKNQLVTIHPGILHTIQAKEDTTFLLINRGS